MSTPIEWTDETMNAIRARNKATGRVGHFCIHVSDGCRGCYAETWQPFRGTGIKDSYRQSTLDLGKVEVFLDEKALRKPLKWKKPAKVFWADMTDLFGPWVPDEWIAKHYAVFALTPHLTHQVVTKRPERRHRLLTSPEFRAMVEQFAYEMRPEQPIAWAGWPLPNVWELVSVEDQATARHRIPWLLETPAAVRGISAEPLLGPLELTRIQLVKPETKNDPPGVWLNALTGEVTPEAAMPPDKSLPGLDWVVTGGESGRGDKPRPAHPDWFRKLRDDCVAAGVAYLFKQWGAWTEPADGQEFDTSKGRAGKPPALIVARNGTVHCFHHSETSGGRVMVQVGKKKAGRRLDGEEWNQFPCDMA